MLIATLLLALPLTQDAPDSKDARLSFELRSLADEFHQLGMFQGAVLVARGDTVLLRAAYGYADAENAVPNVPTTRFRLASVTKQWTAAAVLRLVESGELELDTRLGDVVEGLSPEVGSVNVHQLLSHSAGIIRDLDQFSAKGMGDEFTMNEMIRIVGSSSLQYEPGSSWAYSNAGYVMLSAMIESVTGMSYGDAMQSLCFEPLGLKDSGHEVTGPLFERRARGYQALPDGLANASFENKSYVTGAGSLYSTVDDLYTWLLALLTGRVVSAETLERALSVQAGNYGYGWFAGDQTGGFDTSRGQSDARGAVVHHDGGCPGFSTKVILYPEREIIAIALSNARPSNPAVMAAALADMVLGLEVNRPSVTADDQICRIAIRDGVEAACVRWEALRTSGAGPDVMPKASSISNRGYRYLESNQPHKALRLFELLAELYPDAASTWENLAAAHVGTGDRGTAIELYRMALALDPQAENAKEQLRVLGAGK